MEEAAHTVVRKEAAGVQPLDDTERAHMVVLCDEATGEVSVATPSRIGRIQTAGPTAASADRVHWLPAAGYGGARDVKFSPDMRWASVVEGRSDVTLLTISTDNSVSAWPLHAKPDSRRASAACPMTLGCLWPFAGCCIVVTTDAVEIFATQPPPKPPKKVKAYSMSVHWYRYMREADTLLTCTAAATLQLFQLRAPTAVSKLHRIDIADPIALDVVPPWQVGLVRLYGALYVAQLVWPEQGSLPPDIVLWPASREQQDQQPLRISTPFVSDKAVHQGDVRFQVIDNLLVVHDFVSRTSMLFDLFLPDLPIINMAVTPIVNPSPPPSPPSSPPSLYTSEGIFVGKDCAVDTRDGSLWRVCLNTERICRDLDNKAALVRFLQRRHGGKAVILRVIREMIRDKPLHHTSIVFDRLNIVLAAYEEQQRQQTASLSIPTIAASAATSTTSQEDFTTEGFLVVRQSDMFESVFSPLEEDHGEGDEEDGTALLPRRFVAALVEYLRSLNFYKLAVEPFLLGRLIHTLVTNRRIYQLHQLLQYHVIDDSAHVACQLLSLESRYPAAYQMALDMLKRLNEHERILEVLLAKGQIIAALRFLQGRGGDLRGVDVARFLDVTNSLNDPALFFTAYKFFEQRNALPQHCRLPADQFLIPHFSPT